MTDRTHYADELRYVLNMESGRIGAVSAGLLRQAIAGVEKLEMAVMAHNERCRAECGDPAGEGNCYTKRSGPLAEKLACHDCPRQYMIEVPK